MARVPSRGSYLRLPAQGRPGGERTAPSPGPRTGRAPDVSEDIAALVAFLEARLDELEAATQDMARSHPGPWSAEGAFVHDANGGIVLCDEYHWSAVAYAALNGPAAVLADVAADREILAMYESETQPSVYQPEPEVQELIDQRIQVLEDVISARAERFSSHPDYRQEWAS